MKRSDDSSSVGNHQKAKTLQNDISGLMKYIDSKEQIIMNVDCKEREELEDELRDDLIKKRRNLAQHTKDLLFQLPDRNCEKYEEWLWRKCFHGVYKRAQELAPENRREETFARNILECGVSFYTTFLQELGCEIVTSAFFSEYPGYNVLTKRESRFSDEMRKFLSYKSLICLGDLHRYLRITSSIYHSSDACKFYWLAIKLDPRKGIAHNQLGVAHHSNKVHYAIPLYHYMRSLCSAEPFEKAETNYIKFLRKIMQTGYHASPFSEGQRCFFTLVCACCMQTRDPVDLDQLCADFVTHAQDFIRELNQQNELLLTVHLIIIFICLQGFLDVKGKKRTDSWHLCLKSARAFGYILISAILDFLLDNISRCLPVPRPYLYGDIDPRIFRNKRRTNASNGDRPNSEDGQIVDENEIQIPEPDPGWLICDIRDSDEIKCDRIIEFLTANSAAIRALNASCGFLGQHKEILANVSDFDPVGKFTPRLACFLNYLRPFRMVNNDAKLRSTIEDSYLVGFPPLLKFYEKITFEESSDSEEMRSRVYRVLSFGNEMTSWEAIAGSDVLLKYNEDLSWFHCETESKISKDISECTNKMQEMNIMGKLWVKGEINNLEKLDKETNIAYYLFDASALMFRHEVISNLLSRPDCFVVIPNCVMKELDSLKITNLLARNVIKYLENHLKREKTNLIVESNYLESVRLQSHKFPRNFQIPSPFFAILECAYFYRNKGDKSVVKVHLLTRDFTLLHLPKNLQKAAKYCDVDIGDMKVFCEMQGRTAS